MWSKWFLAGALVALFGTVTSQFGFLEEFNDEFAFYANQTKREIADLRVWNSALIREFNRELLLELARLTTDARANDAEFLDLILNFEDVDDECREQVLYLRDLHVLFQNWDIQGCAYYAWYGASQDSKNRFFPYHDPFARENVRAISQVIQTLGRNRVNDVEAVRYELQDELDYYTNLRESQTEQLWQEIEAHADEADRIYNQLDECRIYAENLQLGDHEYITTYLESNCGQNEVTTLPPTTTEGTETTTEGTETTTEGTETTTEDGETTEEPETTTPESTTEDPETTTEDGGTTEEPESTTPESTTEDPETTEDTEAPETTTEGATEPAPED